MTRHSLAAGSADHLALNLLGAILSLSPDPAATMALRRGLSTEPERWDSAIELAAEARLSTALWHAIRRRVLILPLPGGGSQNAAASVEAAWAAHRERSDRIAAVLREVVAAMNAAGLQPVLLKGAQALWSGVPEWRHVRDIDLLLPPDEAETAQSILRALGFAPYPGRDERPDRHHLTPLFRDDFPAWIEVHRRAANGYAERLIGTSELMRNARTDERSGLRAKVIAPELAILYAMVHHHVGHSADARGTLDLKGLYEFAAATTALTRTERAALVARADREPRIGALLDFWTAAAADLFDFPVLAPLRLTGDAATRWQRTLARRALPRSGSGVAAKYPGYGDELTMATVSPRLARAAGGGTAIGRLRLRMRVAASLLPPLLRRTH